MRVTIEVLSEVEGLEVTKRSVLQAEEFRNDEEFEAAAVSFIRKSKMANDRELRNATANEVSR
ncbi:hypothetical protein [Haloferula sp. BvORR071]|uniref:hypothetical protein n=1 Tax=Haloferula sp. BvORR071 TaxID=1396141 RepID=UPI00055249DA|nr:hypothetical protein [Haloferula sp. BvORR071]